MPTHAIHDQLLLRNVRVEILYEENPVFADEEVSAIVRFRHFGIPKPKPAVENGDEPVDPLETPNGQQQQQTDEESGWFGKRISMQLTNTARALFLEETNEESKDDIRNKPVSLLMGYAQLSGVMTYDPDVIDHAQIDEIRKKAAVSGKIGGLDGLEVSKQDEEGLLSRITWGISGMMSSDINGAEEPQKKTQNKENMVPFFSTPKSLLFSEVTLKDGDTPVYYLKCKLPRELPPSYDGKSIKIQYSLIIGASLDEQIPKPINLTFPLTVAPHFDQEGYQPVASLDNFILLSKGNILTEPVPKYNSTKSRRASFKSVKKKVALTQPKLSTSLKKDKFIEKMKEMANGDESTISIEDFKTVKVRDNIQAFSESTITKGELADETPKSKREEGYLYERQVTKLQTQYIISRAGKQITTLSLSKPIYRIGETIKLDLDFSSADLRTTGVLISLENMELIRPTYSASNAEQKSIIHYKHTYPVYNHTSLPLSLPIPLSATAQFKTNIFECKWCLNLKFILTEEELYHTIHEDATGKLQLAKESMAGFEFNCKLPLVVLPPDKLFGGIIV